MTMIARMWTAGLLACAGVLIGTTAGQAGGVFRLNLTASVDAPTLKLGEAAPEADTFDVRGFRGGCFHRGYCGGGFRGGYSGGFRGGYYGGYAGGYCGGYAGGYYGGYVGGYCAPRCYSYCAPVYSYGYCTPSVYYYYYPISTVTSVPTTTFSLRIAPLVPGIRTQPELTAPLTQAPSNAPVPVPRPLPGNGTYDYDGGPRAPIPMPRAEPAPTNTQPTVPLDGRPVSLPIRAATPKFTYPAYGEVPRTSVPAERTIPVSSATNNRVQR